MKILLTGGTGVVGGALAERLVQEGHQVHLLARSRVRLSYPAVVFSWSGETVPPMDAFKGVDAVIHLAGESIAGSRWTTARKAKLRSSRVETTKLLAQGLKMSGTQIKLYIGASAVGFYGDQKNTELTERSPRGAGFLAELCSEWEAAHFSVPAERHMILRLGVVLSGRGGFLAEVAPKFKILGASQLGSGLQWLSWIHIEDLLSLFVIALKGQLPRITNAVAPEPIANSQMTLQLAKILNARKLPAAPAFVLKFALGEMASVLLDSQRVVPEVLQLQGFQFGYSQFDLAARNILS